MDVMMHLNTQQENEIKVNHHEKREDMEEFYNLIVRNLRGEVSIIMTKEQIKKMREVLNNVDL